MTPQKVLAIVGLTGTGKTDLACEVARRTNAEVLSADSMQVYRGLDIGTAKPSAELRAEIPHHAIDVVDPDDPMSAGRYAELARAAAAGVAGRERPLVLCGGTGLYARAFAGGLVEGIASDPELRAALEARDTEDLYAELERVDAEVADRTPRQNRVRIVRALEAHALGGEPLSAQQARHGFRDRPFDVRWLALGLDRDPLETRIRARVDAMFRAGLVEEVRSLHARGYGPELKPLRAIGYLEAGEFLAGRITEDEARERTAVATRRYAKRQRTWFNAEPGLRWLDAAQPEAALEEALRALQTGA